MRRAGVVAAVPTAAFGISDRWSDSLVLRATESEDATTPEVYVEDALTFERSDLVRGTSTPGTDPALRAPLRVASNLGLAVPRSVPPAPPSRLGGTSCQRGC